MASIRECRSTIEIINEGYGHYQVGCPNFMRRQKKSFSATLSDDDTDESDEEAPPPTISLPHTPSPPSPSPPSRSVSISVSSVGNPTLRQRIIDAQSNDPYLVEKRGLAEAGQAVEFSISSDGGLLFERRLCVPSDSAVKTELLSEAHTSPFSMHPGSTKMYQDLNRVYWWRNMKREVAEFVSRCLVCQQVKASRQKPAGLLQSLSIPEWKWENVSMDFIIGLPRTLRGFTMIWVVVDRLTKSAHFVSGKSTYTASIKELTFKFSGSAAGLFGDSFPFLGVDSIEGHNRESGKGFPTTGPRIEAGNVVIHRGLHVTRPLVVACVLSSVRSYLRIDPDAGCSCTLRICTSFGSTRLICASFGSTRLICASFESTRLICASLGITRLIGVSFGITRLICAFYGTTRLLCRVRVQRGANRREAERMREGHMDASGFLYASADVFCENIWFCDFELMT
ncbi:ty3-gypsy retrotransposon protein [Cucumis melo var. makuwa]|uniref:Ty3-gypsy retrotransposon protein n=1 Tax=Cucumis melo var. makuwa TaxID=1194695 RepID=A0A5A7SZ70_CUCMM|nr:ty3-gypsy retrotransposon protein [Cucumis melo var. makuwa]